MKGRLRKAKGACASCGLSCHCAKSGVQGHAQDKTLRSARIGETVTVCRLLGEGALRRRIMDMGITKGTNVFVRKVAPFGDPIEVTVRGYELSLRKGDAERILVT